MNIKEISDKALKESDVQANHWVPADRVQDINDEYLFLIEKATQIGSKFPMTSGGAASETFTVAVYGDYTHTRTITDVGIVKVEWRPDANGVWQCMDRRTDLCLNCFSWLSSKFTANEKKLYIEDALTGDYRITYERPSIILFTAADLSAGSPPSPDWLPLTFHPLLWLGPARKLAGDFKTERFERLDNWYNRLFTLFENHYRRDATINPHMLAFDGDESSEGHNYR